MNENNPSEPNLDPFEPKRKIPHTAQEALIAELLGDVGILTENIKTLRDALPFLVEDVSTRLRGESSRFVESADRLALVLEAMAQYVDSHTEQAVRTEVEKVQAELRLSLSNAASDALSGAIGQNILSVLRKIDDTGTAFEREVSKASELMSRYRAFSSPPALMLICFLSAMFGAGLAIAGVLYFLPQ